MEKKKYITVTCDEDEVTFNAGDLRKDHSRAYERELENVYYADLADYVARELTERFLGETDPELYDVTLFSEMGIDGDYCFFTAEGSLLVEDEEGFESFEPQCWFNFSIDRAQLEAIQAGLEEAAA